MIARLLAACSRLDAWLHRRFGRPYGIALSVGLVIEIVRRLAEAPKRAMEARGLMVLALFILLNLALLVHQLGELGERVSARRRSARAED